MKKMYILVNGDIEMSPAKTAVQVGHAVESYIMENKDSELLKEHFETGQTKIVLDCSEKILEKYAEQYPKYTVRDAGKTELDPNTLTCVCVGIYDSEDKDSIPKAIQRMRLYKMDNYFFGYQFGLISTLNTLVKKGLITDSQAINFITELMEHDKDYKEALDLYNELKEDK